jgi:hypothetical protein
MPDPVELIIYSRPACHLCEDMKAMVRRVVADTATPARIDEVDVETDPELEQRYGLEVPVLLVNGRKAAKYRIVEEDLRRILRAVTRESGPAGPGRS